MTIVGKILVSFEKWHLKQQWLPSPLLGAFANPFYIIRRGLFKKIQLYKDKISGVVLDFGCGNCPYISLFSNIKKYVGTNIYKDNHFPSQAEFVETKIPLPFPDKTLDFILSFEVLEHVENVEDILKEWHRLLKEDGHILISMPFIWDEHPHPKDFRRYTSQGIQQILENNGFIIVEYHKTTHFIETIFQLWLSYLYYNILTRWFYVNVLIICLFFFSLHLIRKITFFYFTRQ